MVSLGFVSVQPRNGTITIPVEARRALGLDQPGAQVEVILRDTDLLLVPHVAVPFAQTTRGDLRARRSGSSSPREHG